MILMFGPLLGQDTGVTDTSGFALFDLFTRLGVAGVFIYLYYEERKERRLSQERERVGFEAQSQMLERMLPIITEATSSLEKVTEVQETLTDRAAAGPKPEVAALVDQMNALAQELRSQRRGG